MKSNWGLIILGVCFIIGVAIMAHALNLAAAVRSSGAGEHTATVTGYGIKNMAADKGVFSVNVNVNAGTREEGFEKLPEKKKAVEKYLKENGFNDYKWGELSSDGIFESIYSQSGDYVGQRRIGTKVSQKITVTSNLVYKMRDVAVDITNLIAKGIDISVSSPIYSISDSIIEPLKLELIDVATENAKVRATKLINGFSDGFRAIKRIDVGQFRITDTNGNDWNENDIEKKVSVTVHAVYIIKE